MPLDDDRAGISRPPAAIVLTVLLAAQLLNYAFKGAGAGGNVSFSDATFDNRRYVRGAFCAGVGSRLPAKY